MVSNILYLRMKKAVKRLNRSLDEKKRLIRIYKRRTGRPPEEAGKGQPGKGSPGGWICGGVVLAL